MSAVPAGIRRSGHLRRARLELVERPRVRHTLAYALAVVTLLGCAVFGSVAFNAMAAEHAVQARELERQVADGERLYARLLADVAALEDPARIREAALDMGMIRPVTARHLHLERALVADGAVLTSEARSLAPDPLKPVLSVER